MADTTDYMLMGYAAAFAILLVTIGSIWLRYQQAIRNLSLVEQLANEEAEAEESLSSVGQQRFATDET